MFRPITKMKSKISYTIILLFLLLVSISAFAQKEADRPRDLKILREFDDGRGNIIREVQYKQGNIRVTEQIILPKVYTGIGIKVPFNIDTMNKDSLYVVVDKSKYCVQLCYRKKILKAYKAVFGPNPKANKCMEGDRCTPEGWFKISNKNPNSKYNKFMLISYPNDTAIARFNKMKEKGLIPKSARIGGDIGIHGIWQGGDDLIEMGVGWTDGCIALKNVDIEDLYKFIKIGTRVYIKK